MDLRRLRILSTVAEHHGFSQAARVLGIAQPALSRQVQALEAEVGVALLARGARGVELTAAGRALLDGTSVTDARLAAAIQRGRLAVAGRLGTVRIALGRFALDDPAVGRAITACRTAEPWIEVEVVELGGPQHTTALLHGEIDVAVGYEESPHHRRIERRTLRTECIRSAVVAASHPLASRSRVEPHDLRDLPLLMAGRGAGWVFPAVRRALQDLGFENAFECESLETVYGLIAAGRGWAAGAQSYEETPAPGTKALPLVGLSVELPFLLRWRRGERSALHARIIRTFAAHYRATHGDDTTGSQPAAAAPTAASREEPSAEDLAIAARIEARHLRAVATVAAEGSLSDASRRLELTQSAVSRRIAAVERLVGLPVFMRRGKGLVLTAFGEELRAEAIATLARVESAAADARLAARGIARRCTIGVTPSPLASSLVLDLLRRGERELPTLAIEIREMGSPSLSRALCDGTIDLALAMRLDESDALTEFDHRPIAADPLDTVLVSARGPLARKACLAARDLDGKSFLFFSRERAPRYMDVVRAALERAGVTMRVGAAYEGPRTLWRFVAEDAGWTVASRSVRREPPHGSVALPLEGFEIPASLHLVTRRDEADPHVLAVARALVPGDGHAGAGAAR